MSTLYTLASENEIFYTPSFDGYEIFKEARNLNFVCYTHTGSTQQQKPGKWMMTLFWKMCGVNIHLDTNIGKRLTLLAKVLTALTGDGADVADMSSVAEDFETLKEKTPQTTTAGDDKRFLDGAIAQDLIDGVDENQ